VGLRGVFNQVLDKMYHQPHLRPIHEKILLVVEQYLRVWMEVLETSCMSGKGSRDSVIMVFVTPHRLICAKL